MSPLIHRSLTWSIVGTVVCMSTWLAENVQHAHERRGLRLLSGSASDLAAPVSAQVSGHGPAAGATAALANGSRTAALPPKAQAAAAVQLAAARR